MWYFAAVKIKSKGALRSGCATRANPPPNYFVCHCVDLLHNLCQIVRLRRVSLPLVQVPIPPIPPRGALGLPVVRAVIARISLRETSDTGSRTRKPKPRHSLELAAVCFCRDFSKIAFFVFSKEVLRRIQRAKPFLSVLSRFDGGEVDFLHAKPKTRLNRRYEPLAVD